MDNSKQNNNTEKTANESRPQTTYQILDFGKGIEASVSDALNTLIDEDSKADYSEISPDITLIRKELNTALSLSEKLDKNFENQIMELLKAGKKTGYEAGEFESIEQTSKVRAKYLKISSLLRSSLVGLYHSNEPFQEGVPSSCLLQVRDLIEVVAGLVAQVDNDLKSLHLVGEDEELGGMSVTVIEPRFL